MKLGLFVTNQQRLSTDMVSALGDQITMVRHARDRGWDSLFSGQHYLNEGDNKQLQIVPFLARLAAEAGEMTLGLGVLLLNLHNPVIVRLVSVESPALMRTLVEMIYVQALLLAHRPLMSGEMALLNRGLGALIAAVSEAPRGMLH